MVSSLTIIFNSSENVTIVGKGLQSLTYALYSWLFNSECPRYSHLFPSVRSGTTYTNFNDLHCRSIMTKARTPTYCMLKKLLYQQLLIIKVRSNTDLFFNTFAKCIKFVLNTFKRKCFLLFYQVKRTSKTMKVLPNLIKFVQQSKKDCISVHQNVLLPFIIH